MLSERPFVILDEPTAHLDALTEHVVADTLVELARTRAVVVVAHRPALVSLADHVVHIAGPTASIPEATEPTTHVATAPVAPLEQTASYRLTSLLLPTVIGALASAAGVALTACSGWLIVQASNRPAVLTLLVAIVLVRTFGLARPLLRYVERLLSHDTALGMLARRRAEVYDALVPLTPGRLGPRRGDVLASVVDDVDSVLDRELRGRMPLRGLLIVAVLQRRRRRAAGRDRGRRGRRWHRRGPGRPTPWSGAARPAPSNGWWPPAPTSSERVVETTAGRRRAGMWQATERAVDRVAKASDAVAAGTVRSALWLGLGRAIALTGSGIAVALVALVITPVVADGGLSRPLAGLLVLLPLALAEVVVPAVDAATATARARAAEARLDALLALRPPVSDPPQALPAPEDTAVEVRAVTAAWDDLPVLDGLSLAACHRPPRRRGRSVGLGQEHAGRAPAALHRPRRRARCVSAASTSRALPSTTYAV